jgi:hypothetical protein
MKLPETSSQKRKKPRVDEEREKESAAETSKTFERSPSPNRSVSVKKVKVLQRMDVNQSGMEQGARSGGAEGTSGAETEEWHGFARDQNEVEEEAARLKGEFHDRADAGGQFHDQGDAKWIVIGGQLRGHNNMPIGQPTPRLAYRPPGGWPPSGRIW